MCSTCERYEACRAANLGPDGPVAQPGRAPAWHAGSREFESPQVHFDTLYGFTLGGLVAGEGSFCVTRKLPPATDGSVRLRFVFKVTMASRDRALLEDLRDFLGYGSIDDQPARKPHWQPTSTFTIGSIRGHRMATIPFAEQYLLASAKRRQFERWRDAMDSYEVAKPTRWGKGPSRCSEPGCDGPVRGQGLCRSHYYRATGY